MPAGDAAPGAGGASRAGRRRALPGLRLSAPSAWLGWLLSPWQFRAGRKSPVPAGEPAPAWQSWACEDPPGRSFQLTGGIASTRWRGRRSRPLSGDEGRPGLPSASLDLSHQERGPAFKLGRTLQSVVNQATAAARVTAVISSPFLGAFAVTAAGPGLRRGHVIYSGVSAVAAVAAAVV